MKNIMLDLETLGTSSNAAIVSIGAVYFDPQTNTLGDEFYMAIDLKTAVAFGGIIDADTVLWWLGQSDAARAAVRNMPDAYSILTALERFAEFCVPKVHIWGNGVDFDNVILGNAYKRADLMMPFSYGKNRCYRTMKAMLPSVNVNREGTHHHALDDAKHQARYLMAAMKAGGL